MTIYCGVVTIPDGRQFRVTSEYGQYDESTNSTDFIDCNIEDMEGNPLTADDYNEIIPWEDGFDGTAYLWEVCDELVCQQAPELEG